MLRNYLKIIIRIFYRRRIYSVISLLGLVIAFTVSFLIITYSNHELSINKNYMNFHQIYRVIQHELTKDEWEALTPKDLGPALISSIPEIQNMTRLAVTRADLNYSGIKIRPRIIFIDSGFYSMFTNRSGIQNNIKLQDSHDVILTREFVDKYFPDSLMIGKSFEASIYGVKCQLFVSDIIDGFGDNSSIQAEIIGNMDLFLQIMNGPFWDSQPIYNTFLLLPRSVNPVDLNKKIDKNTENIYANSNFIKYRLQTFSDFYLDSGNLGMQIFPTGNIQQIQWFNITAILILFIAIINFGVLSTANAMNRRKEFGIRKTFGSGKWAVRIQAMSEAILMAIFALPMAILTTVLCLPIANSIWGKDIDFNILHHGYILLIFVLISLITGLISGAYLSFYINEMKPISIFHEQVKVRQFFGFRKILIIVQVFIFIVLFSFSSLLIKQFHYFLNKNLGYEPENLLSVSLETKDAFQKRDSAVLFSKFETLKQELIQYPFIKSISYSSMNAPPIEDNITTTTAAWKFSDPRDTYNLLAFDGDLNICKTMGFEIIKGHDFLQSTNNEILLNEAAIKLLGFDKPVGEKLILAGGTTYEVAGVVKNFNIQSFRKKINPLVISKISNPNYIDNIYVRFIPGSERNVLKAIKMIIGQVFPDYIYDPEFVMDRIADLYKNEKKLSTTINIGTALIMLISVMGLFAISLFEAERRTKEVGIRKVNGASVKDIIFLLSKNQSLWVVYSFIFACPVSWYLSHRWLENFAFKTTISWWLFALTGILALVITLLTSFYESYNTAKKNPVDILRYE